MSPAVTPRLRLLKQGTSLFQAEAYWLFQKDVPSSPDSP